MPEPSNVSSGKTGNRLFGLIGYPLSHSFSKKYFTEKFIKEGLDHCRYELFPIRSIEEIKNIIQQYPELEGLNVTIPYKQVVLPLLNSQTGIPDDLRACNCIRIQNGQLTGFNTDWTGFQNSIAPLLQPYHRGALVLGNGGATAAVVYALEKLGKHATIVSRTLHDGSSITYEQISRELIEEHTIIINTTPLGMYPNTESCPAIPYEFISGKHLLYDLVYNPSKSKFLRKGEERGATIKNGEEMLVLQAEESWRIWNS